jgi:signal transduction histidine kinase
VVETVLLQIVQEALHNVWRHSDATRVDIVIAPTEPTAAAVQAATVRITDDGAGFDTTTAREGAGIATMRASAAVVEGSFTIDAAPGAGTTISARLGPGPDPDPDETDADNEGDDDVEPPSPPVLRLVPRLED